MGSCFPLLLAKTLCYTFYTIFLSLVEWDCDNDIYIDEFDRLSHFLDTNESVRRPLARLAQTHGSQKRKDPPPISRRERTGQKRCACWAAALARDLADGRCKPGEERAGRLHHCLFHVRTIGAGERLPPDPEKRSASQTDEKRLWGCRTSGPRRISAGASTAHFRH